MTRPSAPRPFQDLVHRVRRLGVCSPVLHVGAHPDDEDAAFLAHASRGLAARTVYWSASRGEGGQNRTGPERGPALGVVRMWESLSARELDGADVLYGPFFDSGFVKTAEQAFERWDEERLVREIVRVIREIRPSVVVGRWRGSREDGHGAHRAVGIAVGRAWEAAGDPGAFPELALPPWQPRKLYRCLAGDWQPGEEAGRAPRRPDLERDGILALDLGAIDPLTGRSFEEIAALGTNRHRSQGLRLLPEAGESWHYLELERSAVAVPPRETGLFDGFDPRLTGLAARLPDSPAAVRASLESATEAADAAAADLDPLDLPRAGRHVIALLEALSRAAAALEESGSDDAAAVSADVEEVSARARAVAAECFGLRLECVVDTSRLVPGHTARTAVRLWSERTAPVPARLRVEAPEGWFAQRVPHGGEGPDARLAAAEEFDVLVPEDARRSGVALGTEAGAVEILEPVGLVGRAEVALEGRTLALSAPAVRRETVPGGYRELAPVVLPPITLSARDTRVLVPSRRHGTTIELTVVLQARGEGGTKGTLAIGAPPGWRADPAGVEVVLDGPGDARPIPVEVLVPPDVPAGRYAAGLAVTVAERRDATVLEHVRRTAGLDAPGDEDTAAWEAFLTRPAEVAIDVVDVTFERTLRYGYVPGLEDDVPSALVHFDLDMRVLDAPTFEYSDLRDFDALVMGPNAYGVRDDVRRAGRRLLDYVHAGGTLVVQDQGYAFESGGFAPYPFRFSRPHDRVTSPHAPVQILAPQHPLLNVPNRIGPGDFDGWIGDRGRYFFGEWSPEYQPVLACADPGEPPHAGGLLIASHGRGTFAYVGYSLYRQIPQGVAGAVRLFANLLGLAEARLRERIERARGAEVLRSLTDAELREVVRLMSERRYAAGEMLCHEGDVGGDLYVVLDGRIEVGRGGGDTWRRVAIAEPGEVTGELAVLADAARSASLRALEDSRVLTIPGPPFRRLVASNPALAERVIRMLATKLAEDGRAHST